MTNTARARVAALLAAAAIAAGCGSGGDEEADQAPAAGVATPVAQDLPAGVAPEQSAALAVAALGSPAAVDAEDRGRGLSGLDAFGGVRDAFEPLVEPVAGESAAGDASESESGAGAGEAPAITMPDVVVPPAPAPVPVTPAPSPVSSPAPPTEPGPEPRSDAGEGPEATSPWRPEETRVVAPPPGQRSRAALRADISIGDATVSARRGEALPPDTQQFVLVDIGDGVVTLRLTGALLPNGSDLVTLRVGQSVTLEDTVSGRKQRLTLIGIRTD